MSKGKKPKQMLHRFYYFFIRRTHFWRTVTISEMAELYSSRMLRVMAMNMMGGFGIVFFYQLGYSLHWLAWYYVAYFSGRVLMSPLVAITIARYGPKHGTLISNFLFVVSSLIMASVPVTGVAGLIALIPIAGFSRSLYDACYLVDFSKVKHIDHAGKELGLMQIIERVMTALGPILGGIVAYFFGPALMMVFAAGLMLSSALPLFFTNEPTKTHQKLTLRHFNLKATWRPLLGHIAVGIDTNASGLIWNLFVALVVLGAVTNGVYLKIGILSSIALLTSIVVSYLYGRLVDNRAGKKLLWFGVLTDVATYFSRPFATTPLHVAGVNISNEVATSAYSIPALRGIFDTADGLPGYRIVFITSMTTALVFGDVLASIALVILTGVFDEKVALKSFYVVLAPFLLFIGLHTVAVYRRGILTRFIHRV